MARRSLTRSLVLGTAVAATATALAAPAGASDGAGVGASWGGPLPPRPSAYVVLGTGAAQFDLSRPGSALVPKQPPLVGPPNVFSDVALSADGRSAYLTEFAVPAGQGPVTLSDLVRQYDVQPRSGQLAAGTPPTVQAGLAPSGVAVSPDDRSVYVVSQAGTPGAPTRPGIAQYDRDPRTGRLSAKSPAALVFGTQPVDLVVRPDGRFAYVADQTLGVLLQLRVDPGTGALTPLTPAAMPTGSQPLGLAVSPDGRHVYDTDGDGVSSFRSDPATGQLTPTAQGSVPAGTAPIPVVVSPDGRSVYVGNEDEIRQYDRDPATGALTPKSPATAPLGTAPFPDVSGVASSVDGRSLYASSSDADATALFQYDVARPAGTLTPKVPPSVTVGSDQGAIAVTPDAPVARLAVRRLPFGLVLADARRSRDLGARIATYRYDFGDGTVRTSRSPVLLHHYRPPGRYRVSVTLTSENGCTVGRLTYTGQQAVCAGRYATARETVVVRR